MNIFYSLALLAFVLYSLYGVYENNLKGIPSHNFRSSVGSQPICSSSQKYSSDSGLCISSTQEGNQ